jgi:hypothetical protein
VLTKEIMLEIVAKPLGCSIDLELPKGAAPEPGAS